MLIRPTIAVAIAVLAELVAIVGGDLIWGQLSGSERAARVLALVSWNLVFVLLFAWLFLNVLRVPRETRIPQWHPVLVGAIVIALATMPLAGYGVPGDRTSVLLFSFLIVPVAAIGEELLYRGIVQTALEWVLHPVAAILLSSGLFVLSHIYAQPIFQDGPTATSIAATGVILGAVYQRTRNLLLVVTMHAVADWILLLPHPPIIDKPTAVAGNILALAGGLAWWWRDCSRERKVAQNEPC